MTVSLAASLLDFSAKGKDFSAFSSFLIHIFIYTLLSYITIPTKIIKFKPLLQSRQVKRTSQLIIDYLKNQSVSCLRNWCQIQIGIPACRMSSEYFMRTSLYLVRLKIFEWIKLLRRHLRQIQGNWGGRNFITASRVNSRIHYACKNAEMNLTFTTTNGFDFWILSSLMKSWGVRLTRLENKIEFEPQSTIEL